MSLERLRTENQSFNFNTFSGTELEGFINVKLIKGKIGDDEKTVDKNNYDTLTLKIANLSSLSFSLSTQVKPKPVLGRSNPIGLGTGVRTVYGSLTYEVFTNSVFADLKEKLETELADKDYTYVGFENGQLVPITGLTNFDSLPPFDLVITAVKENNQKVRMKKVIKHVILTNNASAIGLNSITVQESYEFIASRIEPFKNHSIA